MRQLHTREMLIGPYYRWMTMIFNRSYRANRTLVSFARMAARLSIIVVAIALYVTCQAFEHDIIPYCVDWFFFPLGCLYGYGIFTIAGICWLYSWRRSVLWTSRRRGMTVRWTGLATLLAGATCWGMVFLGRGYVGHEMAPMVFLVTWVFATSLVWRETPSERRKRLLAALMPCDICGYDLSFQIDARCPECGTSYTLGDLFDRWPR